MMAFMNRPIIMFRHCPNRLRSGEDGSLREPGLGPGSSSTCRGMGDDHTSASEASLYSTQPVCVRCWRPILNRPSWSATAWPVFSQRKERHDVPNMLRRSYTWRLSCQRTGRVFRLDEASEGDGEQVLANVVVEGEPPVAVMPAAASRHVIIGGSVSNEEAQKKYPKGWKAPKPCLRIVSQPK
jgi:hypothetical protein